MNGFTSRRLVNGATRPDAVTPPHDWDDELIVDAAECDLGLLLAGRYSALPAASLVDERLVA